MNHKLYVLGLVLTDGTYNKGAFSIELKKEDSFVLKSIA